MIKTLNAEFVRNCLNGVVCIYKPQHMDMRGIIKTIKYKLCTELNSLDCREPKKYVRIEGDTTKPLEVNVGQNYADNPLMCGPRFVTGEMNVVCENNVQERICGVSLVGINDKVWKVHKIHHCNPLSTYHITGEFGLITKTGFSDGRVLFTCNYNKLQRARFDKIIATIHSGYRRQLISSCGYNKDSRGAYELLASGASRPSISKVPVVYDVKCIDWQLPQFTIEIVCANESQEFLVNLIREIGSRNRNAAVAVQIRRIRYAFFTLKDALLKKHWSLQHFLDNMKLCDERLENEEIYTGFLHKIEEHENKLKAITTEDVDDDIIYDPDLEIDIDINDKSHMIHKQFISKK